MTKTELFFGAFAAVASVGAYLMEKRVTKMEETLNNITKSVNDIADDVDLTVPEDIVKTALVMATNKAADKAVNTAVASIKTTVTKNMDERINATIKEVYSNLEGDMEKKLSEKINLTNIEEIKSQVSQKVADQVLKSLLNKVSGFGGSSKADVIKTMSENGFTSYDISRVLESMDK
jgi:actin-related protein